MSFKEVSSLDADVTIALGKKNKETGKPYPKQIEGYYLGSRTVENKRGESQLHFLQTANGNVGVWGTTDLNRKLSGVEAGTMIRVTSTGTKPTPNGDMYTYKVEVDSENTIEVSASDNTSTVDDGDEDYGASEDGDTDNDDDGDNEEVIPRSAVVAKKSETSAKLQEILSKGKRK